jgi:hypothetical protein
LAMSTQAEFGVPPLRLKRLPGLFDDTDAMKMVVVFGLEVTQILTNHLHLAFSIDSGQFLESAKSLFLFLLLQKKRVRIITKQI